MTARKIAILGGGPSALTAAFWLTEQDNWQEKYDLTVYQMGWRLGGKVASGRNPNVSQRNEEHGYHMLFGFYENVFATMRGVYDALGRGEDEPLAEFCAPIAADEDRHPRRYAMKRNSKLFLAQEFNGEMKTIDFDFPTNDQVPGDGKGIQIWTFIEEAFGWLERFATNPQYAYLPKEEPQDEEQAWYGDVERHAKKVGTKVDLKSEPPSLRYQKAAGQLIRKTPQSHAIHLTKDLSPTYDFIVKLIEEHLRNLWQNVKDNIDTEWEAYRSWILQDFVGTTIIGFLKDNLIKNGFDSINHLNYFEWLHQHATIPEGTDIMLRSVLVQFAYDACFAYNKGDAVAPRTEAKPPLGLANMEAGTMLRGGMRLFLTYKGSVDWLFQAGAGEVLVAPMYQALKRRGVKFKFFHKVTKLVIPDGSDTIESVEIDRQATLNVGDYDPLVLINGLPAWPDRPHYDQLVEGTELRDRNINLESHWTNWTGTPITLERGTDFDDVLLAIPIGALKYIATDLAANNGSWQEMFNSVQTVRTFGFQTWMNKTLEEMGWTKGKILTDTGTEPVGMEADATQIIDFENWPADNMPVNLTYFGGVTKDDPDQPPAPDPAYPPTQAAVVREIAVDFLNNNAGTYWPLAVTEDGFRWDWLVDVVNPDAEGEARFDSQFWKNNIDPSERYVLSLVDTTKHRLKAGETGYKNLYIAGDWIHNGINAGCMEATVMSGMQASRAISGYPQYVFGEDDFALFNPAGVVSEVLVNVVSAGVDLVGGLSAASADGAEGFREEFSTENLAQESIPSMVGKGIVKGTSRFARGLVNTFNKVRKDIF